MLWDPTIFFLLPTYVEVQALALEFLASPPSQIISQHYHQIIRTFIDDETLKDV
jgi:hypothetical protein